MNNFFKSVRFALNGISSCFRREPHFKFHSVIAAGAITTGILLKINYTEWFVVIICIAAVLSAELVNTALEELCNMIHKEYHPRIRVIKDMAAGAVLITAFMAVITGGLIFIPKIFSIF